MIEAMACGTPVLAFRNGSVPEVIDEGVTGFIVDSEEEAVSQDRRTAGARPRARAAALRGALHGHAHGCRLREALQEPAAGRERAACTALVPAADGDTAVVQ